MLLSYLNSIMYPGCYFKIVTMNLLKLFSNIPICYACMHAKRIKSEDFHIFHWYWPSRALVHAQPRLVSRNIWISSITATSTVIITRHAHLCVKWFTCSTRGNLKYQYLSKEAMMLHTKQCTIPTSMLHYGSVVYPELQTRHILISYMGYWH